MLKNKGAIIESLIIHLPQVSTNLPYFFFLCVWADVKGKFILLFYFSGIFFFHNNEGDHHKSFPRQIIPHATL